MYPLQMNFEEGRNEALAQGVAYFVTEGFMKLELPL